MDSIMTVFSGLNSSWRSSSRSSSATAFHFTVPLNEVMQSVPGFHFNPTDEELVLFYLKRMMCGLPMNIEVIYAIDIYKCNPEDLLELSLLETGDRQWFFLTCVDKKYCHGSRFDHNTGFGLWKLTGNDHNIISNSCKIGTKKTLVFYDGEAQTDWVMHEYSLTKEELRRCQDDIQGYYALCKIFKKSGYGLKNGEPYCALFGEDWANNGLVDFNVNASNEQLQLNEVDFVGTNFANDPILPLFDFIDFEEMDSMLHGYIPWLVPFSIPDLQVEACFMRPEVVVEDPQGIAIEQFIEGVNDLEPFEIFFPDNGVSLGFEYVPNIDMEEIYADYEFLENNGVIDPNPASLNIENLMRIINFESNLTLDEAGMILTDMWHEQETFDHSYINSPQSDADNENYQLLPNEEDANQIGGEFWMHDERNILNLAQDNDSFSRPTPDILTSTRNSVTQLPNNDST